MRKDGSIQFSRLFRFIKSLLQYFINDFILRKELVLDYTFPVPQKKTLLGQSPSFATVLLSSRSTAFSIGLDNVRIQRRKVAAVISRTNFERS